MSTGASSGSGKQNSKGKSKLTTNDIDYSVAVLTDGDFTKRDTILWTMTMQNFDHYFDIQFDKIKFRKRSMWAMGYNDEKKKNQDLSDEEYMQSIAHFKHRKCNG